jgi:hypothetical protein
MSENKQLLLKKSSYFRLKVSHLLRLHADCRRFHISYGLKQANEGKYRTTLPVFQPGKSEYLFNIGE